MMKRVGVIVTILLCLGPIHRIWAETDAEWKQEMEQKIDDINSFKNRAIRNGWIDSRVKKTMNATYLDP